MEKEKADLILSNAYFKFAKTMQDIPHAYTLISYWEDPDLFHLIFHYIQENGVKERFFSKEYTYYYLGEYKYWSMLGYNNSPLINRAKVK